MLNSSPIFNINIFIDPKENYDFVTVDASINGDLLSNPDATTITTSLEAAIDDLLIGFKNQNAIPIEVIDSLLRVEAIEVYDTLYNFSFNDVFDKIPSYINRHAFFGTPDGPEPFLSSVSFMIINDEGGFFIYKNKKNKIVKISIDAKNIIEKWEHARDKLHEVNISRLIRGYENRIKKSEDETIFSAELFADKFFTPAEKSILTFNKIKKFFKDYNLLISESQNKTFITASDLSFHGWLLWKEINEPWFKSKRFKNGDPDIAILHKKLVSLLARYCVTP